MYSPRLLLVLLLFAFAPLSRAVENGVLAPDFKLPTLEGKQVSLSDFKGQVIVLKLATTWCPTCQQQSQEIGQLKDYLLAHDVAVVEVFVQDSEQMVRDYVKGMEFAHPILLDDGRAARAYNLYLIPRLLLIDRDFKVQRDGSLIGAAALKESIGKLLGG